MSSDDGSKSDRDLLARLNALKKSPIDLNDKKYQSPLQSSAHSDLDPLPARALYDELSTRFNSFNRRRSTLPSQTGDSAVVKSAKTPDPSDPQRVDDDTAIEDLLAELGPEEQWNVGKDDEDEVERLLNEAQNALKDSDAPHDGADPISYQDNDAQVSAKTKAPKEFALPSIDMTVFQPEPASDDEKDQAQPGESKEQLKKSVDDEADEYLQRILDEIQHEPPDDEQDMAGTQEDDPPPYSPLPDGHRDFHTPEKSTSPPPQRDNPASILDLPSTPAKDPEPSIPPPQSSNAMTSDEGLSERFASLALPSVPMTKPSSKPSTPTSSKSTPASEVDTWCIICNDDAVLRCIGCDGDLYCTDCWLEGHRGESAGYEERTHKAVQYNKTKKKPKSRIAQGAV